MRSVVLCTKETWIMYSEIYTVYLFEHLHRKLTALIKMHDVCTSTEPLM